MTEVAAEDAREFRPWRLHRQDPLDARRRELFALAAPVFRQHGYRGSTVKALAHACGLKPASLYHYFGSKREMATYLLSRPRMDWDSVWVDPATEPRTAASTRRDGRPTATRWSWRSRPGRRVAWAATRSPRWI